MSPDAQILRLTGADKTETLLTGGEVLVNVNYTKQIAALLKEGGQGKLYNAFCEEVKHPSYRSSARVYVRLFTFDEYFHVEDARALVQGKGYAFADAWVAAQICNEARELQLRKAILALGTVDKDITNVEQVLACRWRGFLQTSNLADPKRLERVAVTVPIKGGFESRYAVLGMRAAR